MNKVFHGGETLLQAKADRAKGNAVGESDIPDEDDHEGGAGVWISEAGRYTG